MSACISVEGNYADDWQQWSLQKARLDWSKVKSPQDKIQVRAKANYKQYQELYYLDNNTARTEVWAGVLKRGFYYTGTANNIDFKQAISNWDWLQGKSITFGPVVNDTHPNGYLYYSKGEVDGTKCLFANIFSHRSTNTPTHFTAKAVGYSCLKPSSKQTLDDLMLSVKKIGFDSTPYNGGGLPED